MSADRVNMCKSLLVMLSKLAQRHPEIPGWVLEAASALPRPTWPRTHLLGRLRPVKLVISLMRAFSLSPRVTVMELMGQARHAGRLLGHRTGPTRSEVPPDVYFLSLDPDEAIPRRLGGLS